MEHAYVAADLFMEGYNCAQSVFIAFCDLTGLSKEEAAKMSSTFGAGIGGYREVCGAVTGMAMVLGCLYGYDSPTDQAAKKKVYDHIHGLLAQFEEKNGSIICRELLKNIPHDKAASPRTAEYYAKRPCARFVMIAAELLDEFIAQNQL